MRTRAKALARVSVLLAVPLMLGAIALQQRETTKAITQNTVAPNVPADIQSQPTIQPTAINPTVDLATLKPEAASSAGNYAIDWFSINGGGTVNGSSTNYGLGTSIGQAIAGIGTSTNYQVGTGFWYGASGGCTCPCKYDPQCDGIRSNVQDVAMTVNIAFRGTPGTFDSGCSTARSDVDNNGSTNVVDLVKVVNVAFRGSTIASQYIDPCTP